MAISTPAVGGRALLIAIGVSLLVGIVGAIVVDKLSFYFVDKLSLNTSRSMPVLYMVLGYSIGCVLRRMMGRSGVDLGLIAVGIMAVALGVICLIHPQFFFREAAANAHVSGVIDSKMFPEQAKGLSFILWMLRWILAILGLAAAYKGAVPRQ